MMPARSRVKKILMDGRYRWGYASRRRRRYGRESLRLAIYPPGTTDVERRVARLSRAWPLISTVLLCILLPGFALLTELPLVVTAPLLVLLLWSVGSSLARISRSTVKRTSELFADAQAQTSQDVREQLRTESTLGALDSAEMSLEAGDISWAHYRTMWENHYWEARGHAQ